MSEQIKRLRVRASGIYEGRGPVGLYFKEMVFADMHDAALAAKDARIAELEGLLDHVQEGSEILQSLIDNIEAKGNYSAESTVNFLRQAHSCLLPVFAAQQKSDPCEVDKRIENAIVYGTSHPEIYATPSEDGREVPEAVAWIMKERLERLASGWSATVYGPAWAERHLADVESEPLMTVAQHARIAAAKDAEIARLKGDVKLTEGWTNLQIEYEPGYPEDVAFGPQRMMDRLKKWLDAYFALRLAQPTRQVGGDEREQFGHWFCEEFKKLAPSAGVAMHLAKEIYWIGWQARAALAPAAVVMPERSNERGSDDELTYEAKAWNACLDRFAELNGGGK